MTVNDAPAAAPAPLTFPELMDQRWSCRAFLADEVPDEQLTQMFALAQRTASWCNTQPWQVHVTTGEATQRFSKSLTEHVLASPQTSDLPMPTGYSGVYQERRREGGYALYASLGIDRADGDARLVQMLKNYTFFGAPHVAVITTDREQGVYGAIDCGGYVANLMHAAHTLGIATVPQAAIAMYSDHVREFLELPEDRMVVCAVSFGYADLEDPVNAFRTTRADVADVVTVLRA
ncbi:nitroreductase [Nocardioides pacificus]